MQRIYLVLLCFICGFQAFSQSAYPYQDIKLEKPADYVATEPMAVSAANFLLATPFSETDAQRSNAVLFLSNWMTGTKAYHFYINGIATEVSEDRGLLSLFMAALAKFTFENKSAQLAPLQIEAGAAKLVLAYTNEPKNNFKIKKKYRKYFDKN